MKLKYRIKEHTFLTDDAVEYNELLFFTAQYKILGLWLNINDRGIGRFTTPLTCYCEEYKQARDRINLHKLNMKRAGMWWTNKFSKVTWEEK